MPKKRLLGLLLAVLMIFSLLPTFAAAADHTLTGTVVYKTVPELADGEYIIADSTVLTINHSLRSQAAAISTADGVDYITAGNASSLDKWTAAGRKLRGGTRYLSITGYNTLQMSNTGSDWYYHNSSGGLYTPQNQRAYFLLLGDNGNWGLSPLYLTRMKLYRKFDASSVSLTVRDYDGAYDGAAHGVGITGSFDAELFELQYRVGVGEWTTTAPSWTDATGSPQTVGVRLVVKGTSVPASDTVTATVNITKTAVSVTAPTITVARGAGSTRIIRNSECIVSGASASELDFELSVWAGSVMVVGPGDPIGLLELGEYEIRVELGTNNANFDITTTDGVLRIVPFSEEPSFEDPTLPLKICEPVPSATIEIGGEPFDLSTIDPADETTWADISGELLRVSVFYDGDEMPSDSGFDREAFLSALAQEQFSGDVLFWVNAELFVNDVIVPGVKLSQPIAFDIPLAGAVVGAEYNVLHYTGAGFERLTGLGVEGAVRILTDSLSPFVLIGPDKYWTVSFSSGEGYAFLYDSAAYGALDGTDYSFVLYVRDGYYNPDLYDGVEQMSLTTGAHTSPCSYLVTETAGENGSVLYTVTLQNVSSSHDFRVASIGRKYTLAYDADGGTGSLEAPAKLPAGSTVTVGAAVTKDGFDFGGWRRGDTNEIFLPAATFPMPAADVTLTAVWTPLNYSVTFDLDGDTTVYPAITGVAFGAPVTVPAANAPTAPNQTFLGWKRSDTGSVLQPGESFNMPALNLILTAQWRTNAVFGVTYDTNGGTGSFVNLTGVPEGSVVTIPSDYIPENTGHTFSGWRRSDTGEVLQAGDSFNMPSADIVLTAQWDLIVTYTVTYIVNGVTTQDTTPYAAGEDYTITVADPTSAEHFFTGWRSSADGILYAGGSTFKMPAQNVSLVAEWIEKDAVFSVVYNVDGDTTVYVDTNTYGYGEPVEIPLSYFPSKPDFTFSGWKRSDTGEMLGAGDYFNMPALNLVLTAQWTGVEKYSLNYDLNGASGTMIDSSSPYSGGAVVTVLALDSSVSRPGFRFLGWNTNADGSGTTYQPGNQLTMPEANLVLYAVWGREYTVTFRFPTTAEAVAANPSLVLADQTVLIGDHVGSVGQVNGYTVTDPITLTSTDFYFDGWVNQNGKFWSFDYDVVDAGCFDSTGVMTLTAVFSENQHYNIIFSDNLDYPLDDYVTINGARTYDAGHFVGTHQVDNVAVGEFIPFSQVPVFRRTDYTFAGWYLDEDCSDRYAYEPTAVIGAETFSPAFVGADRSVVAYAKWIPNYTAVSDVTIDPDSLTKEWTYNEYYSSYITATHRISSYLTVRVYRNFKLLSGSLPDGLYLNERTGEVYGVPSKAGTYTFRVVMGNDQYVNAHGYTVWDPISEEVDFTVTIVPRKIDIDHSSLIYSKTYGDNDLRRGGTLASPAIQEDEMLSGHYGATVSTPISAINSFDNLTVAVEGMDETWLTVYPDVYPPGVQEDRDEYIFDYDYSVNNLVRTAFADAFDTESGRPASTLMYAPDLNAPVIPDENRDKLDEVALHRETGENAGLYKVWMGYEDVKVMRRIGGTYYDNAENYLLTIAEAFTKRELTYNEDTGALETDGRYVFTIVPAEVLVDIPSSADYRKVYGTDDGLFGDKLDLPPVSNAAQYTIPTATATDNIVTIAFANGITDRLSFAYTRVRGEDVGAYKIYLLPEAITGVSINGETAADRLAELLENNYSITVAPDFAKTSPEGVAAKYLFNIDKRTTTFAPTDAPFTYGDLRQGVPVPGTFIAPFFPLADNSSIGVVDSASAAVADYAKSGAGCLKAGGYSSNALLFTITNGASPLGTASADTSGNYTVLYNFNVLPKAITVDGRDVTVMSGAALTEANLQALTNLNGILPGDTVGLTVTSYAADTDDNGSDETYATAAALIAAVPSFSADLEVKVNYSSLLTGADGSNYTLTAGTATGHLRLYVAPPPPPPPPPPITPTHTITATAGTGGTISPSGSVSVSENSSRTFTITASAGYAISDVRVDGASVGARSTYTFTNVTADHVIEARFVSVPPMTFGYRDCLHGPDCPLHRFTDLDCDAWYHDGVHFCIENNIMRGIGGDLFDPNGITNRAMLVTMLYRLEGEPVTVGSCRFADVARGAWYESAVIWADTNGIIRGYDDRTFAPDDPVSREQFAAILYRYAGYKGYSLTEGEKSNLSAFSDAASISPYALEYMKWANGAGLFLGNGDSTLRPASTTIRSQAAVLLLRFYEWIPGNKG